MRGIARAWVDVLVRPRQFFRTGVAPGEQAPGLAFAVAVAVVYVGTRLATGTTSIPPDTPVVGGTGALGPVVVLLAVAVVAAPAVLHLAAALQTLCLLPLAPGRAGVSETVQTVAYATAPCALAGLPSPALRAGCAAYGVGLLVVGLSEVHDTSIPRATVAGALPATLVFGVAFDGITAAERILPVIG